MTQEILLVMTTCADADTAARLAESLLERRLAACVNAIEDVNSTYRWSGRVERAAETLLLIKTTPARYPALERHIREHSGYELPEIVAVRSSGGLDTYLAWVHEETTTRASDSRDGDNPGDNAHDER
ncbi:MAG TPA: divalent-cation tolerance protein CutA [Gammaproteobacteria bacterium]|nr:divalent-cation tolerance protein CutA [Gammaproteobacteria bacterium]